MLSSFVLCIRRPGICHILVISFPKWTKIGYLSRWSFSIGTSPERQTMLAQRDINRHSKPFIFVRKKFKIYMQHFWVPIRRHGAFIQQTPLISHEAAHLLYRTRQKKPLACIRILADGFKGDFLKIVFTAVIRRQLTRARWFSFSPLDRVYKNK